MALFCGSRFVAAQTPAKIWRIGYLSNASGPDEATEALRAQITGLGYQEGRNVLIEYCWGAGREARLAELTSGLVRIKVDVIVVRGQQAAAAAKRATSTVPIVMAVVGDPVGTGLVANLAHPGAISQASALWQLTLPANASSCCVNCFPRPVGSRCLS